MTRPGLLPAWTVGHVLGHLFSNAESHIRLLQGAQRGESVQRYPGGVVQRSAEIEAGACRSAADLVADIIDSSRRLEATWGVLDDDAWSIVGESITRREPADELPWLRWREIEVHHVDLGLDFTWADWSPDYVRRELRRAEMGWRASHPMGLTSLPVAALAVEPRRRLAWLLGRTDIDGVAPVPQWF